MRYILMHKTNAENEAGRRPSPELIAAVGRMIGEMTAAGAFRDGTGLRASSLGVRIDLAGGRRTVTLGPFTGGNELASALCVVRVRSRDEAVEWASRLGEVLGDAQIDVRPVTEPWDLGLGRKPEGDPTTRYMAALKADRRSESGERLPPAQRAAIARLVEDMKRAGVYVSAEVLQPSSRSKRLVARAGRHLVTDGPFAESKELIAGFVILELPSIADAMAWAARYVDCLGETELDVRPLYEPGDLG
jgi:hypothetical protein